MRTHFFNLFFNLFIYFILFFFLRDAVFTSNVIAINRGTCMENEYLNEISVIREISILILRTVTV